MKDGEKAGTILSAIRDRIDVPLTIKIRTGWDASGEDAFKIADIAQACGVNAIAIHPRTAPQGFTGKSDWSMIARLKQAVDIPVIGNGDIETPEDAVTMLSATGCDAVMAGRAAIGNPWIFSQIHSLLTTGTYQQISLAERFDTMKEFVAASVKYIGETHACRMMRSRLTWFAKGLPNAARFRASITQIRTQAEAEKLIDAYYQFLVEREEVEDQV